MNSKLDKGRLAYDIRHNWVNSFVWQLAGPQTNATNSLVSLNLVQPLLRGGGRIITISSVVGIVSSVVHAAGFGLLVAAVFAERGDETESQAPAEPGNPA